MVTIDLLSWPNLFRQKGGGKCRTIHDKDRLSLGFRGQNEDVSRLRQAANRRVRSPLQLRVRPVVIYCLDRPVKPMNIEVRTKGTGTLSRSVSPREYLLTASVVGCCTVVSILLRPHLTPTNLVMVYFVGVLVVASRCGRFVAILASAASVAAFDFFCVPPYYTFAVADYEYVITFAVMFVVALIISTMTSQIRLQTAAAIEREAQTSALYRLSNELAAHSRPFDIATSAAALAEETFGCRVTMFLAAKEDRISFSRRTSDELYLPSADQKVAQWVCDHRETAGTGMPDFPGASALYIPVMSAGKTYGVMACRPAAARERFTPEHQHLMEVFASQTGLAIERATAASIAQSAGVQVETETLRTSLLSAVSHDLRTPLASITGAAGTLRTHWNRLDPYMRDELLQSVTDEAERLNRLLNNLLEVTRLETGVQLHREAFPLEEVVGAALHRLHRRLEGRPVRTEIPPALPMVAVDAVLLEQVFINLLENALKYTPAGTDIAIVASREGNLVQVEVRDSGPGFHEGDEDVVFDKFFRGRTDNIRGAGLGLAICRAIVEAHGGTIHARNRPGGGAIIGFTIPMMDRESALASAAKKGS
jgi:two-component system sensor histidine kinase KdpD